MKIIKIDGAEGEGGGQVLRSALSLSMVTGIPFEIKNIRGKRKRPGLLRQHLTSVRAAMTICSARVEGMELGSTELKFFPGEIQSGNFVFSVGSAGSTTLVLQTVIPALILAPGPSTITLEGGTHNPFAPPFDFLQKTFCPVISRMGPKIELSIERYGFFPAGGGKIEAHIEPCKQLTSIDLSERGEITDTLAEAVYSHLSTDIAERELRVVGKKLAWNVENMRPRKVLDSPGPGNVMLLSIVSENITEVITEYGKQGLKAEKVARMACQAVLNYIEADVPVGVHLADQLLLPMALAGSGSFRTVKPDPHTWTNCEVIQMFLNVEFNIIQETELAWRVAVKS